MALPLPLVGQISRSVAASLSPDVIIDAVLSSSADAGRAEILLTVVSQETGQVILNLTRADRDALERELRASLSHILSTRR